MADDVKTETLPEALDDGHQTAVKVEVLKTEKNGAKEVDRGVEDAALTDGKGFRGVNLRVGDRYQAKLPEVNYSKPADREGIEIESPVVWQASRVEKKALAHYISYCGKLHLMYFGTDMPPKVLEAMFLCLRRHSYDSDRALEDFNVSLNWAATRMCEAEPFRPFSLTTSAEKTFSVLGLTEKQERLFVESMLLVGKDLRAIGQRMASVEPSLVVRYYYQHYKQITYLRQNRQRGFRLVEYTADSKAPDPREEQNLDPRSIINALRVLALSNHDSFEVDRRVAKAVSFFRNRRTWVKLIKRATAN